jgi:hypothetical protein
MNPRPLLAPLGLLAVLAPAMLVPTTAFAADKAACLDAAANGQRLRDAHKLVDARDRFRLCAASSCPAVVQADCVGWLAEVEKAVPAVVLVAHDAAGADLTDVAVTVDGQPLAAKLDGRALSTDAGLHTFRFVGPGGAVAERKVLVKEGDKSQTVAVVLGAAAVPAAPAVAAPAVPPPATGNDAVLALPAAPAAAPPPAPPPASSGWGGSWRTVGWVVGAAGVVGLGVGAAFGAKAISDKSAAHCDASGACDAGPLSDANTSATISTVGLVAGGVLLAGGAALVLFAPKGDSASGPAVTGLRIAPMLGPHDGGLVAACSF